MRYAVETFRVRLSEPGPRGGVVLTPEDAVQVVRPLYRELDADQEHFSFLALDGKSRLLCAKVPLFSGGQTESYIDPKVLFRAALLAGAVSIILVHNHPSGDPEPSEDDLVVTRRLVDGGVLLGMTVVDHIILGAKSYVALRSRGGEKNWAKGGSASTRWSSLPMVD